MEEIMKVFKNDFRPKTKSERKKLQREIKFAILGAVLFTILTTEWASTSITKLSPLASGNMILVHKIVVFIIIFYIIQKMDWFQDI